MRVALVSPYSWTYPGGVTRHIEGLAEELLAAGHEVRVLAPFDPDTLATVLRHRGARPQVVDRPEWLIGLGTTVGWTSNGSVGNIGISPENVVKLRRELSGGRYDVVHLHEPSAPIVGWDAVAYARAARVGTFHCYSTAVATHTLAMLAGSRRRLNHLHVRIAVSRAAEWTARRFYGGRYRVIPNGVALPAQGVSPLRERAPGDPLNIVFVGQAVERKGLPVLLRAFEALRRELPATLTLVGPQREELAPLLLDAEGVRILGRVSDADKQQALADADVLCAPSLGGESFGMVLTEAFAAGRPVLASDIAGYRDVVRHGHNGLLLPRGDAVAWADTLRELALRPDLAQSLSAGAAQSADRYAWPTIAREVTEAYEDALALPEPAGASQRLAVAVGIKPADLQPPVPAARVEPLDVKPGESPRAKRRRYAGLAAAALAVGGAYAGLRKIGIEPISTALLDSSPTWVLAGLALMISAMALRAVSWHAMLKASLPDARPRFADAFQGTAIGVLMSATLPARLGEPSRALIVARRLGDPRERLPAVVGTLVSQTLLNLLALLILGAVMFATVGLFSGRQQALLWYAIAPVVVVTAVVAAPALLRSGMPSRSKRLAHWLGQARDALTRVRWGLRVFADWRLGSIAVSAQLGAWALQWLSCYMLLLALGFEGLAGLSAAAAVLFAVNVSAVLPVTPSNVGVFQAACVAVLTGGYEVPAAEALAYGIVLQAVEIATAIVLGAPALVKEGVSWREVRLRALHTSPVSLSSRRPAVEAEA